MILKTSHSDRMIPREIILRMDKAINNLDLPDGTSLEIPVGQITCVNKFMRVNQKMIHSDASMTLKHPAFQHIVEAFEIMKERNFLIEFGDQEFALQSMSELQKAEQSAKEFDGFTGYRIVKKIEV